MNKKQKHRKYTGQKAKMTLIIAYYYIITWLMTSF